MLKRGLTILAFLVAGCAPYVPLGYQGEGSATLAKIDAPELTIYLEHIGSKYQHSIFDLEVINRNPAPVYLSPQRITFFTADERFPRIDHGFGDTTKATKIVHLKKKRFVRSPHEVSLLYQTKEKNSAGVSIFFALISVGLAVYDDVKNAEDRKKQNYSEKDARQAATRNALVTAGFIASDLAKAANESAQQESHYLPYEIFSEGNIDSLSRKRGKIFLPQGEDLRYLRIVLPIENKEYVFDFKRKGTQ
jgi:hypothetical protein